MTITAKFPGCCAACHQPFAAGAKIEWSKGSPAKHAACAGSTSAPAAGVEFVRMTKVSFGSAPIAGSGRGRRTGCRCGSREDAAGDLIPSDRNCASCERDA